MQLCIMIGVAPSGHGANFNIVALLAVNNVINVKLCVVKVTSAALFRPTMELFQNQRWEIL